MRRVSGAIGDDAYESLLANVTLQRLGLKLQGETMSKVCNM